MSNTLHSSLLGYVKHDSHLKYEFLDTIRAVSTATYQSLSLNSIQVLRKLFFWLIQVL